MSHTRKYGAVHPVGALIVATLGIAGCQDLLMNDPAPAVAGLAVSYTLIDAEAASPVLLADLVIDRVTVTVHGEDGARLAVGTVDLAPPGEETRVQLAVPMDEDLRTVRVVVELISEGEVVAFGSTSTQVESGETTEVGVEVRARSSYQATVSGAVSASISGNFAFVFFCPTTTVLMGDTARVEGEFQLVGARIEFVVEDPGLDEGTDVTGARMLLGAAEYFAHESQPGGRFVVIQEVSSLRVRGSFEFDLFDVSDASERVRVVGSFTGMKFTNCN